MEKILQMKQEITIKLLAEYNAKIATEHTMRLERLQEVLRLKNAKQLQDIKHQYFRNMRKLERKYFEAKPSIKRDIIKEYIEFDSSIYAALCRNGPHIDLLNPPPNFQFDLHRDIEGIYQY